MKLLTYNTALLAEATGWRSRSNFEETLNEEKAADKAESTR